MSNLSKRLDLHFVAVAAAAGAAVSSNVGVAEAGIVHVPGANIPVNADFYGVYLNVVTGATGLTTGTTPGWDINPFLGPAVFTPTGGGVLSTSTAGGAINLAPGTPIGAAGIYDIGTANGLPANAGQTILIGFRFINEAAANQVQFGWANLRLPEVGAPGMIFSYAYDDMGATINAGSIPTPGALGLLAVGAAGLAGRRRKN